MNRHEKEQVVSDLKQRLSTVKGSFLVGYKGLDVGQMQSLREQLRACGGSLRVAKDRLVKLAVEGVPGAQDLTPYLQDQIALVFASDDFIPVAKVIADFSKSHTALNIVVGCIESDVVDKDKILRIASLPSRDALLAQVCGTLLAPISAFARVLNAIKEKREQDQES